MKSWIYTGAGLAMIAAAARRKGSRSVSQLTFSSEPPEPSCWRYSVLTSPGMTVADSKKGRVVKGGPFETVALRDVRAYDSDRYTTTYRKDLADLGTKMRRDNVQRSYSHVAAKPCDQYLLRYPRELLAIAGSPVFVHTHRTQSDFAKPIPIPGYTLPKRGPQVGLKGIIIDPSQLPHSPSPSSYPMRLSLDKAEFVYYNPYHTGWWKLSDKTRRMIEGRQKIDGKLPDYTKLAGAERLKSAEYVVLTNFPGSRLPFVVVWGGVFR